MTTPSAAYRGSEPYVFVSYAHANVDLVYAEIAWLQQQGVRLWYDASGISAGSEWSDEIAGAIKSASVFVYFITPESAASEHCRRELNFAQNQGCRVIAVYLEETEVPDGLRLSLDNRQAILKTQLSAASYQQKLLQALTAARSADDATAKTTPNEPVSQRQKSPMKLLIAIASVTLFLSAVWLWSQLGEKVHPPGTSVAVLPFVDLSASGDQQHFGDGMADEIINALTELDGLQVAARTSSFAYRDRQTDLRETARELQVNTILEGSIRRDGERVRITAQLVNAADGFHLWSDTYERELNDLFAIQIEIAEAVAATLGVTLGVGDVNAFLGAGTRNIQAFEGYQRSLGQSRSDAIRTLKRVVEMDPGYAAAWASLGLTTAATMWDNMPERAPDILEEAVPYLLKAIELENESAYAYSLLAVVSYAGFDWIDSEEFFQQAFAIAPSHQYLHHHANMMMRAGRTSDALAAYRTVSEAVRDEQLLSVLSANTLLSTGQFDLLETLVMNQPAEFQDYMRYLIAINDRDSQALKLVLQKQIPVGLVDETTRDMLLRGFDAPADALAALRMMFADETVKWPSKYHDLMLLAAYFGDPELAVEIVSEEASRTTIRLGALWYPVLTEARALPEFRDLVQQINLPAYWRAYGWSDHCWPTGAQTFECG